MPASISKFIEGAYHADILAVDTETNGEDVRDSRGYAIGLSIAYREPSNVIVSAYFPFRHTGIDSSLNLDRSILAQLKQLIENHPRVVFHNSKFDIPSLETIGIIIRGVFYDTMLMQHMIDENVYDKSLDAMAFMILGERKLNEVAAVANILGWQKVPIELMDPYACQDAKLTLKIFEHLFMELEDQELHDLWLNFEQDWVRLLTKMEKRGVLIDQNLCKSLATAGENRMTELAQQIGLNPGSPKQLSELLLGVLALPVVKATPKGKPSFDKEAMQEYDRLLEQSGNPLASLILEYRGWQKAVTSNYRPYLDLLSPDGRLRPNYKIHGTVTGRLSCEKPNLQQIPKTSDKPWNGSMKQCFIPMPGYVLIEADYSQLELRLGAAYAKEQTLLSVFEEGRDIFSEMAAELGMARHETKTMVYTIQYGGGVRRISSVFGCSPVEAARRRDSYYSLYPGFKTASSNAGKKAFLQGYLRLWSGRRRHFRNPKDEAHKAFNSVIQGGAAEIVKRTMLRLEREVDNETECRMLLQVHDSVVFEVKADLVDHYKSLIKKVMEAVEPDFGVKFNVDVKVWGA